MASITIRNLDDEIKQLLRIRAAEHGRSMEEEAREILRASVAPPRRQTSLWHIVRAAMDPLGGVDLSLPLRTPPRGLPKFET